MQESIVKTVACAIIALMMAVLLGGHTTEPMTEGESVVAVQEVNAGAEMPRTASLPRRVVKRWAHLLILRSRRSRHRLRTAMIQWLPKWNAEMRRLEREATRARFRGAVRRLLGAPRRFFDEWRDARIEPQCADCGVHQDDGFAVDTTLKCSYTGKTEPLCIDCHLENEAHADLLRSLPDPWDETQWEEPTEAEIREAFGPPLGFLMPLCAAAILAIFAPQWAGLALVGATRQPMPDWTKKAKKEHGANIRRHSKRNSTQCFGHGCTITIFNGDLKGMLPASGYTQNKPHCEACTKSHYERLGSPSEPSEPTPAPTPEPASSRPVNRKADTCAICSVAVPARAGFIHSESPRGKKIRCADHAETPYGEPAEPEPAVVEPTASAAISAQVADLTKPGTESEKVAALVALLSSFGGANPEEVRRMVKEETTEFMHTALKTVDEIREAQSHLEAAALEAVEKRLEALNRPVVLHHGEPAEPLTPPGEVEHHMLPMFLRTIGALQADGAPLNLQAIGPAGTGKTHMGATIHDRLTALGFWDGLTGLPERPTVVSCNAEMQPSDLLGRVSPRFFDDGTGAKAGTWAFTIGPGLRQFCLPGTLIFDEVDTLSPSTQTALNAMLANGFIDDMDGVRHYRHPRCIVYATANTRGDGGTRDYTASHASSVAFLDRFAGGRLEVDFSPAIEEALAPLGIVERIREMRRVATEQRMSRTVISYRALTAAAALHRAGWTEEQAVAQIAHGFDATRAEVWGYGSEPPVLDDSVAFVGLGPMDAADCAEFNANANAYTDANATGGAA